MKSISIRKHSPFTQAELQATIASAYAEKPWDNVSEKYAFLPTSQVISALYENGMGCYAAKQSGTRIIGKEGFTKHSLRFRPLGTIETMRTVGGVYPEIVLTNSHDRASAFSVELGLYRLVCSNGLLVSSGSVKAYKVRHVSASIESVVLASKEIVGLFHVALSTVANWQSRVLSIEEKTLFANKALALRYKEDSKPFDATRLLEARRQADYGDSLWQVYNVIQENLTKKTYRRRYFERTSREIKSIDIDMQVNRNLWALASEFVQN